MSLLPSLHTHINVNGQAKHRHQGCTVASSPPSGVHSNFTCRACVQSEPRAFELGGGLRTPFNHRRETPAVLTIPPRRGRPHVGRDRAPMTTDARRREAIAVVLTYPSRHLGRVLGGLNTRILHPERTCGLSPFGVPCALG